MFISTRDCPPETAFTELFAGQLAGDDARRLGRHLETCDVCRDVFDALSAAATNAKIAREILRSGVEASAAPSAVGRTLDRKYALLRSLGRGGMGDVYEAQHLGTGRRVAVKLIGARMIAHGDEAERRFRREAMAAGALQSPHIVEVLDAGKDAETGEPYLVLELLHGEDLQHLIERVGPLPADVALHIAAQVLAALVSAHEAGIVHRDIKPANLFLARGAGGLVTVKIVDFGVAKVKADALQASFTTGLTRTEGVLGSPLYMSPEQMQNSRSVDFHTDLWSLGSVLYTALAGRAPYQHVENLFELLPAVRAGQAPALRDLSPWVPAPVAEAVGRALAVAPEDRYPSAAAMLKAVLALTRDGSTLREETLVGVSPEVRTAAAPPARWRSRTLSRVAVSAALVLGFGAAMGDTGLGSSVPGEVATATSAVPGSASSASAHGGIPMSTNAPKPPAQGGAVEAGSPAASAGPWVPVYANDFEEGALTGLTASGTLPPLTSFALGPLPTDGGGLASPKQSTWLGPLGYNIPKSTITPEIVQLALDGLTPRAQYRVAFDLFIGASWDGSATEPFGPDLWSVIVSDGMTTMLLVDATFSNCCDSTYMSTPNCMGRQICGVAAPQTYSAATPLGGLTGATFPPKWDQAHGAVTSPNWSPENYSIYYFGHDGGPVLTFTAGASTATLTFQRGPGPASTVTAGASTALAFRRGSELTSADSYDEYWALDNIVVVQASPLTTCPEDDDCGAISDRCGGTIRCGICASGDVCTQGSCALEGRSLARLARASTTDE